MAEEKTALQPKLVLLRGIDTPGGEVIVQRRRFILQKKVEYLVWEPTSLAHAHHENVIASRHLFICEKELEPARNFYGEFHTRRPPDDMEIRHWEEYRAGRRLEAMRLIRVAFPEEVRKMTTAGPGRMMVMDDFNWLEE